MAFPRKGSVLIHVDGIDYRWRVRNRPTYSQALSEQGLVVTIQTESNPLCVLRVTLNCARPDNWILENNDSVTPSKVSAFIRAALADGWQPNLPGSAHEMHAELEM
ncbi:MAG: hypothetical protein KDB01_25110 [Planctomycetaceae bacterium]|nr:hypothetical protein [Planctomycetaceae bacterium]